MITLINKKSKNKYMCLDHSLKEGKDSWYDKKNNMSFPKADWYLEGEEPLDMPTVSCPEIDEAGKAFRSFCDSWHSAKTGKCTCDNSVESD